MYFTDIVDFQVFLCVLTNRELKIDIYVFVKLLLIQITT